MKRIAVQQGLYDIEKELRKKGYDIVKEDDTGHIDAIVYESLYDGLKNFNNYVDSNPYGAILINCKNKTVAEIEYIIETRRYDRLFT